MVKEGIYTRKYLSPVARDGERGDLCLTFELIFAPFSCCMTCLLKVRELSNCPLAANANQFICVEL